MQLKDRLHQQQEAHRADTAALEAQHQEAVQQQADALVRPLARVWRTCRASQSGCSRLSCDCDMLLVQQASHRLSQVQTDAMIQGSHLHWLLDPFAGRASCLVCSLQKLPARSTLGIHPVACMIS